MKILVVGSGGREHALVRTLRRDKNVTEILCAPGNGGIACDARCIAVDAMDIPGMVALAKQEAVDLVVVAPDDPLAAGMVDALQAAGIRAFGPTQAAAQLESSKVFAKTLMLGNGIPTAGYEVFCVAKEALSYLREKSKFPVVIKADGLALGKGVIIAQTVAEAEQAVYDMMENRVFGNSGRRIVIEEFLQGPEVSVLAFTDGKTIQPMVSSMDHKRALDGDKGLNTGGMGTVSPNPFYTEELAQQCMDTIFLPTIRAMQKKGMPFAGCLYFGLMLTADGPKVIEYNARFGDPEAQVVLPRLLTPLSDILVAVCDGTLESLPIAWAQDACACVMLASGGYPASYKKGFPIKGLKTDGQLQNAEVFHSGTTKADDAFYTNGGRVLGISAKGATLQQALDSAYTAVASVSFEGMQYRRDIGKKALF